MVKSSFILYKCLMTLTVITIAVVVSLMSFPLQARASNITTCNLNEDCKLKDYTVKVLSKKVDFDTTNDFLVEVLVSDNDTIKYWNLQAKIIPFPNTEATEVPYGADRIIVGNSPNEKEVKCYFPISGSWWLDFTISKGNSVNEIKIPVKVTPPAKIPDWLAWCIGLSPLLILVWFLIRQMLIQHTNAEQNLVISFKDSK